MITIRKSEDRGNADHGWLHSRHTFSFANYFDPDHMGFGTLRVINEDKVAPARGFGKHPHENMEIISYVVDGSLAHEDSEGHRRTIHPGWVQYMSAGTGVYHSEFNGSDTSPVHFLQIWVIPEATGTAPRYEDRDFGEKLKSGSMELLASPSGDSGSVQIGQDAKLFAARTTEARQYDHVLGTNCRAWIQLIEGGLRVNGVPLAAGDGAAIEGEEKLEVATENAGAHFLLFDLAA